MTVRIACSALLLATFAQSAGAQTADLFAPRQLAEAHLATQACKPLPAFPAGPRCSGSWRGTEWMVTPKWTGTIGTDQAKWTFHCARDAVDQSNWCTFSTGDDFYISISPYKRTLVNWGSDVEPGSAREGRFEGGQKFTMENTGSDQAKTLLRQMMRGGKLYYRWSDWPSRAARGGELKLAGFETQLLLFETIASLHDASINLAGAAR